MSILITQKDVKHLFGDKSWYINKKLERVYPKTSLFRISDRRTEIYDGRVPAIDRRDRQTDGRTPDRYITLSLDAAKVIRRRYKVPSVWRTCTGWAKKWYLSYITLHCKRGITFFGPPCMSTPLRWSPLTRVWDKSCSEKSKRNDKGITQSSVLLRIRYTIRYCIFTCAQKLTRWPP